MGAGTLVAASGPRARVSQQANDRDIRADATVTRHDDAAVRLQGQRPGAIGPAEVDRLPAVSIESRVERPAGLDPQDHGIAAAGGECGAGDQDLAVGLQRNRGAVVGDVRIDARRALEGEARIVGPVG